MVSKLEKIVRSMDDREMSVERNAKSIALLLEISKGYAAIILTAKRRGFDSYDDSYKKNLKIRGFDRVIDYMNYLARKRGFKNFEQYQNFCHYKKEGRFTHEGNFDEGKGLLDFVETAPNEVLDRLPDDRFDPERISEQKEIYDLLDEAISRLKPRDAEIIRLRFLEGKSQSETGKLVGVTRTLIPQIEDKSLRKLYFLAKESGLDELYASRQDLMKQ